MLAPFQERCMQLTITTTATIFATANDNIETRDRIITGGCVYGSRPWAQRDTHPAYSATLV